jgi:hypothetical protein
MAILFALIVQAASVPASAPPTGARQPIAPAKAAPAGGQPPAPPASSRPLGALLAPAPSRRAIVLAAVRAEWPSYDAGAKGRLTPLEFSTWVLRSHGLAISPPGSGKPGVPAVKAMNATATAFALADADHDGGVTPDEMTAFLTR